MFPVGVAIVVSSPSQKCLLGQRLKPASRGLYGLPGGALEPQESLLQCVQRELREEVGLPVDVARCQPEQLFAVAHAPGYTDPWCVTIYFHVRLLVEVPEDQVGNPEPDKCAGWKWVDPIKLDASGESLFGKASTLWAMRVACTARMTG